jgi:hypothetical protein
MIESIKLISLEGLTPAPLYFVKRGAYGCIFRSKEGNLLLNFQSVPESGNKPENFSPLCEAERGRGVSSAKARWQSYQY